MLSGDATDDIDLRWDILSQKLEPVGYRCLWYGKGHTGYKSMKHMPTHRSFEHWTGFMGGAQSYTATQRWKDAAPYASPPHPPTHYSAFCIFFFVRLFSTFVLTSLSAYLLHRYRPFHPHLYCDASPGIRMTPSIKS